jgi:RNA polymerase sigma-70 factor (ECF subfamily)
MEEAEAIKRLQQGDIKGLEVLVHRYQRQALRTAFLISRDAALSEDIVQAAFLRAYERIHQFDVSRSFGPWFLRSVANDALMAVTRHRVLSLDGLLTAGPLPGPSLAPGPDEAFLSAETREEIWTALEQLAPVQRAAIVQRYFLDYSDAELARHSTVPGGTIRRRLHDARRRLRQLLPVS